MDFTGSLIREFEYLPRLWFFWFVIAGLGTVLLCKIRKMTTLRTVSMVLLVIYIIFILFETVIGRKGTSYGVELIPFWSYSRPDLYWEIVLNYVLFIPLGFLLYISYYSKLKFKVVYIGLAFSCGIEVTQLLEHIGLFEFDDIFGNTIGCLLGALLGKVVVNAVRSYCSNCE